MGILRSPQLRRANFGAMALLGSWFGFQFMGTLYMQDLRDWSAVGMALAFLPTGIIVATASPSIGRLVNRVGTTVPIAIGLASLAASYVLFLNIGANTDYLTGMLPTFILAGIGFALTFGPLNMAATGGVAPQEQGLASGLVYTSFQVGGAIGLAIATAVIDAAPPRPARLPGVPGAARRIPPGDPDLAGNRGDRHWDHGGAAAVASARAALATAAAGDHQE